ncbi:MAG: hypothetical protein KGI00_01130 [Candidatus Micrarchaeota archaeon]|nr:hypothetical protein [Candidatus Micrarchaeota archaeon]MDE1823897.1 hypothetical protein [Candidatus Micrarchaeota archaeon]MDE1849311.1 hypothetical protein [Candidatus Micrarchaeota archaeon]
MSVMRINLRKGLVRLHMSRRHAKAADLLKSFVARHQKVDKAVVKLDKELNQHLSIKVSRSMEPIEVNVEKVGDGVSVKLAKQTEKAKEAQKSKDAPKEKASVHSNVKPKPLEPPKPHPLKNEPKDSKVQNKT